MKTIIITLALVLSHLFALAQSAVSDKALSETTITVNVPVNSDQGNVIFGLYDEATFMKAGPLLGLESDIIEGKASVTFEGVPPGTYAVVLFHDKNGNKQMDFEPNGMPKEMYGVSNNIMSMGPPLWSDAKFEVNGEPLTLEIRM
mgnify:FL=1|jgi:uncharacterized protein (DUF2141 family)